MAEKIKHPVVGVKDVTELYKRHAWVEQPPSEASYIVFRVADRFYAKSGDTGEIEYASDDASKTIQYAIDRAYERRGGLILLKTANYTISRTIDLTGKHNIALVGETVPRYSGGGVSLILAEGANCHMIKCIETFPPEADRGILIKNIRFHGYKTLQTVTDVDIIHFEYPFRVRVEDCYFIEAVRYGIYHYGGELLHVRRCYLHKCGTSYQLFVRGTQPRIVDNHIDCDATSDEKRSGIYLEGIEAFIARNYMDRVFYGLKAYGDGRAKIIQNQIVGFPDDADRIPGSMGIYLENRSEDIVMGNCIRDLKSHGIAISAENCIIKDNIILDTLVTPTMYSGVYLYDAPMASKYNIIVGNVCRKLANYGVKEASSSCDYNVISENQVLNVDALGANTVVKHNIGYATENRGITSITGDGVTTTFTVDVSHGLVSDKIAARVACKKPASYRWWLVDTDADGFFETLRIEITFDTAPASGEVVEIYWEAVVVD